MISGKCSLWFMERGSREYCTEFDLTEENNFNKTRAERTDIASIFTVLNQTVELNCVFSILNIFFFKAGILCLTLTVLELTL